MPDQDAERVAGGIEGRVFVDTATPYSTEKRMLGTHGKKEISIDLPDHCLISSYQKVKPGLISLWSNVG